MFAYSAFLGNHEFGHKVDAQEVFDGWVGAPMNPHSVRMQGLGQCGRELVLVWAFPCLCACVRVRPCSASDSRRYQMTMLNLSVFPAPPSPQGSSVSPQGFLELGKQLCYFLTQDPTGPHLMGIHLILSGAR